jgi:hypothetical protein
VERLEGMPRLRHGAIAVSATGGCHDGPWHFVRGLHTIKNSLHDRNSYTNPCALFILA